MKEQRHMRLLISLFVFLCIFFDFIGIFNLPLVIHQAQAACDGYYAYRRSITIDYTKVGMDNSGTLPSTGFPVLVSLSGNWLKTTATDPTNGRIENANGYDIIFRESDGTTPLDHEIENYDGTNGILVAWVRVDSLSKSSNTTIYMYYGNKCITSATENPTNVWDTDYEGVWHLEESVADEGTVTDAHEDSTSNNNDGDQKGNDETGGKIANGQVFDSNDYIDVASISAPTDKTFTLWIYANALTVDRYETLIEFGDDLPWFGVAAKWIELYKEHPYSNTQISTGQWYHIAYTSDSGTNTAKIYLNGSEDIAGGSDQTANTDTGSGMGIAFGSGDLHFRGIIDEVRVSSAARSADWIKTLYNNQNDPGDVGSPGFYSVGNESYFLGLADHAAGQESDKFSKEQWGRISLACREKIELLSDISDHLEVFSGRVPEIEDPEARALLESDQAKRVLSLMARKLRESKNEDVESMKALFKTVGREAGVKGKLLYMPVRIAITGRMHGPELLLIMAVLGAERSAELLEATVQDGPK